MDTTDLIIRPCPHCGGDGTLCSHYSEKVSGYFVFVKCDICRSQGTIFLDHTDPSDNDWRDIPCNKAVRAWNRRCRCNEIVLDIGE